MRLHKSKVIKAIAISLPVSLFIAFISWSVLDYLTYFGGYDRVILNEIRTYDSMIRAATSVANSDRDKAEILSEIPFSFSIDLTVIDQNSSNIVYKIENKSRWQHRCCEGYFIRSREVRTIDNLRYEYSYYIVPKFSVSLLQTISFSLLPDYFYDKRFSFAKWRSSLIHYEWQKSVMFYSMFAFSFLVFFVWSIGQKTPEEEREIAYERLSGETERLRVSSEAFEAARQKLVELNQDLAIKRQDLALQKERFDGSKTLSEIAKSDMEKAIANRAKEIAELNELKTRIERSLAEINEDIADENENVQDTQNDARIADLRVEFRTLFGSNMPIRLIDQLAESMFLYTQNPEYISQIMHAWFNGFDYLIKKKAEPYWRKSKKHLLLGEAIKLLRKYFSPKEIDYYELKAIVGMRNRFSHFETEVLTIDNLRSLKAKLFGYKNVDGLFYKLVNIKKQKAERA